MSTNPTLMVFDKSAVDMDIMTWCKWINFILGFFYWTFQLQNRTNLNAQNNAQMGTCQVGDILVVVHMNFTFKSSMETIHFNWLDHLVGNGEFGIVAYARMTPNGRTITCVSIATKSCICLQQSFTTMIWHFQWLFVSIVTTDLFNK
jgi:hypothetical protein